MPEEKLHGLVKPGWFCAREEGHEGPCACWPVSHETVEVYFRDARPRQLKPSRWTRLRLWVAEKLDALADLRGLR